MQPQSPPAEAHSPQKEPSAGVGQSLAKGRCLQEVTSIGVAPPQEVMRVAHPQPVMPHEPMPHEPSQTLPWWRYLERN